MDFKWNVTSYIANLKLLKIKITNLQFYNYLQLNSVRIIIDYLLYLQPN